MLAVQGRNDGANPVSWVTALRALMALLVIAWLYLTQGDAIPMDAIPYEDECRCLDPNCWQGAPGPVCGMKATIDI